MGQAVEAAYLAIRSKRELFGKGLEVELGGEEEAVEQWDLLLSAAESCKFRFGVTSHNCTAMWQALKQRAENEQGPFSIRDQQHIFSPFESLAAPKAKLASNLCASVPLLPAGETKTKNSCVSLQGCVSALRDLCEAGEFHLWLYLQEQHLLLSKMSFYLQ